MMNINYTHSANQHTVDGPRAAFPLLFSDEMPKSLLDVGCGIGTWIRSAMEYGISDVIGIDGIPIPSDQLLFPLEKFLCRNLNEPIDLNRRFDAAICLEVAEHLEPNSAKVLVESLTRHSDLIIFAAACPGQPGQHHINCQWPSYWQELFNDQGYSCEDSLRWHIWNNNEIEPWYRQNIFIARRNLSLAGKEKRLLSVIHPDIQDTFIRSALLQARSDVIEQVRKGCMKSSWYLSVPILACFGKLRRLIRQK
jgi:SAM-dependent methyltransferase